jgi:hypothetical protein
MLELDNTLMALVDGRFVPPMSTTNLFTILNHIDKGENNTARLATVAETIASYDQILAMWCNYSFIYMVIEPIDNKPALFIHRDQWKENLHQVYRTNWKLTHGGKAYLDLYRQTHAESE